MDGKVHSKQKLAIMIKISTRHVQDSNSRNGIVSKCPQEIGKLVAGILIQARTTIDLTEREFTALSGVVRH